jgi:hypothetical protein
MSDQIDIENMKYSKLRAFAKNLGLLTDIKRTVFIYSF